MSATQKALVREICVVTFFIVAAVGMTWPLAMHLSTAIAQPDDPFTSTWAIDWDYHALTHGKNLFNSTMFAPARESLAFGENLFGVAIFGFPLFALGVAPLTIHNLLLLAGFASCGYAMFLLARSVTMSTGSSVIAGIAFAFAGMRFHHLPHLHLVWTPWLPLLFLMSVKLVTSPTLRHSLLLALILILNGLTSLHWFAFGSFATAVTLLLLGFLRRRSEIRFWVWCAVSFSIAGALLAPFLIPYSDVAHLYGMHRDRAEVIANGARWHDWLVPNLQSKLYGRWSRADSYSHERTLFPGFVTLLCALAGLMAVVRRRATDRDFSRDAVLTGFLWIAIGALGARGLYGFLHTFLFEHSMVFRGMRMPVRWAFIAYPGLDLLVALGVQQSTARWKPAVRVVLVSAIAAALLFELRAAPIRWYLVPTQPRGLDAWLADVKVGGPLVELPVTQSAAYTYLWRSTNHHQPLINGVTSYIPPHYVRLQTAWDITPIPDAFLDQLEALHCSLVIVHANALGARTEVVLEWLRRNLARGRLAFIRRFDAGTHGDFVFAVLRNEPELGKARAPEIPDASGRTPGQNAVAFLGNGWTYSGEPMASVDEGPTSRTIRGKVTVSGWALAPQGVREVWLRFQNGRVVIPAQRFDRQDVRQLLPWYHHDPLPGFYKVLDEPPAGIEGETDLQVEIVDAAGAHLRLAPFWFRWLHSPARHVVWNESKLEMLLSRLDADTPVNRQRLISGSASIHDFTNVLLSDSESERDSEFSARVVTTVLGDANEEVAANCLRMLKHRDSRERVIEAVLLSRQFASTYLREGSVVID